MQEETDCQNFLRVVKNLRSKVSLDDYTDNKQLYDYSVNEYFLFVLCWAGWRVERQLQVWKEIHSKFKTFGRELHELQPVDVAKLSELYPLPWQKKWLRNLINFLKVKSITAQGLVESLRRMGYENARKELQGIVQTDSEKIVDCWLRDIAKIDAFPIDVRIRNLLKKYGIPDDSDFIIKCCKQNNIQIRPLTRALYENAKIIGEVS